jgi:hypothetical protein
VPYKAPARCSVRPDAVVRLTAPRGAGEQQPPSGAGALRTLAFVPDARFPTTESVVLFAFTADGDLQRVLFVIPTAGVDLIEITKAAVDRNFSRISITATSDEPGAVLTAFGNNVEVGLLELHGGRYTGRFDLTQPINNVEVRSNLGGCAQRAVPFGNNSLLCSDR